MRPWPGSGSGFMMSGLSEVYCSVRGDPCVQVLLAQRKTPIPGYPTPPAQHKTRKPCKSKIKLPSLEPCRGPALLGRSSPAPVQVLGSVLADGLVAVRLDSVVAAQFLQHLFAMLLGLVAGI